MQTANLPSEVTATEQNKRLVLRIQGGMTAPKSEAIHAGALSAWDEHPAVEAILLDMSEVPQIDSSGVGVLVELANRAEKTGVPMAICCLQNAPRRLLNRTHLDGFLRIYPTVGEALLKLPPKVDSTFWLVEKGKPAGRILLDGPPPQKSRSRFSRRLFWSATMVLLLALAAVAIYFYLAIGAYRGNIHVLTAIQNNLVSTGRRIDATATALRSPGAPVASPAPAAPAPDSQQRIADLQSQVEKLRAIQEADSSRIANLEDQVRELQSRDVPRQSNAKRPGRP